MRRISIAVIGAVLLAAPVAAQPIEFSALIKGELGIGTNPFLRSGGGVNKAVGLGAITIDPTLKYATSTSVTTVTGDYNREQYFSRYGNTESAGISLLRTDQFSERLGSTLSARYLTTNRALLYDVGDASVNDPFNVGQRVNHLEGNYGLQYQANAANSFNLGLNGSHVTYGGGRSSLSPFASDYTQYGVSGGYNRVIDARTSVGLQGSVSSQHSQVYPRTTSYQPSLTAKRQINAIWNVEGHIGLVLQRIGGAIPRSTTSLGFGATLCAVYPRTNLCFYAEQGSQPSGYGGLRKDLSFRATLTHDLTEHSHVTASAGYDDSRSNQVLTPSTIRSAKAFQARADYSRDLSQRISTGFGGRYQTRDTGALGKAHEIAGTVNISAKLGRI